MRTFLIAVVLGFSAQAHALTPREVFMEQVHSYWGANLIEEDLNIITGDMNDDGIDDTIGWQVIKAADNDYYLELMAVVDSKKYGVQSANVRILISNNVICTAVPFIEIEAWHAEEKAPFTNLRDTGSNAIRIYDGGKCDSIYLFWPLNTPHANVDLRMPRN